MKKPDKSKPQPSCTNCKGWGAYPANEQGGLYVLVRLKPWPTAVPCRECWRKG
jgi:hypothetical protein